MRFYTVFQGQVPNHKDSLAPDAGIESATFGLQNRWLCQLSQSGIQPKPAEICGSRWCKITHNPEQECADFGVEGQHKMLRYKEKLWWTHLGSNQGPAD